MALLVALTACGGGTKSSTGSSQPAAATSASSSSSSSSTSDESEPATPASVSATVKDFAIGAPTATAPGGLIDFTVTNNGPSEHEFIVFQTDLAHDKLPIDADGRVDEASDQMTNVFDSGGNVAINATSIFHTALTPGKYVLVCNLPGHYAGGMHTAFTVT